MVTTVPLSRFMPYGAPDLLESERRHMTRALMLASLMGSLAFLAAWPLTLLRPGGPPAPAPVVVRLFDVAPPPPLIPDVRVPTTAISRPSAAARGGDVKLVPDELARPEATLPSQEELGQAHPGAELGPGTVVAPPADDTAVLPGPDQYVYAEELPVAVTRAEPRYPDIARDAGVEGRVVVKALVGKDGRVMDVVIAPGGSIPLLDDAALEAARRWVFKPALANGHPVIVWVALRFDFSLR
jgi:protein TonB